MDERNKYGLMLIILTGLIIVISSSLIFVSCENSLMEAIEKDVIAVGPVQTYMVTYDGNGADSGAVPVDSNSYAEGSAVNVAIAGTMSRTSYTFIGWNTEADGSGTDRSVGSSFSMPAKDITLHAKWTHMQTYMVTFDSQGGSSVPSQNVIAGGKAMIPSDPFKMDYVFKGWYKESACINVWDFEIDTVTDNLTLYANWMVAFTVYYSGNGFTEGNEPDDTNKYVSGSIVTVLGNPGVLCKTGYNWAGWNIEPDGAGTNYAKGDKFQIGLADVTLYAKWTPQTYIITYDANVATGGVVPEEQAKTYGIDLILASNSGNLVRDGYTFAGWNTAADGNGSSNYIEGATYTENESIVLFAKWISDINSPNIGFLRVVPAGSFQRNDMSTNISTITNAFLMSENEITRSQFNTIIGADPTDITHSSGIDDPVQEVDWFHAIAFCNKLSIAEGLSEVYSVTGVDFETITFSDIPAHGVFYDSAWDAVSANWSANGYRLPTEMEWMWAAMGATSDRSNGYFGAGINTRGYTKGYSGSVEVAGAHTNISNYAWYVGNSINKSHPAGSKSVNELGLYDMSGNSWEWVWDRYGIPNNYPSGLLIDYRGAQGVRVTPYRVLRGGSWLHSSLYCTVAYRVHYGPLDQYYDYGFRVVRP